MEIIGTTQRTRWVRTGARAGRLALAAIGLSAIAMAAGPAPVALVAGTPSPTASPAPTAPPTPSPSPSPAPTLPAAIGPEHVAEAQERLNEIGYPAGSPDGEQGAATHHAILAFQKVHGLERNGTLTPELLQAVRTAGRPEPRFGTGRHVEIDLTRQVLFYVDGTVQRVVNISSGTGKPFTSEGWTRRAITPRGHFKVQRKIPGWRISPLGELYYPSYFVGGIAVHGAPSVPAYPASHGCIRVPMHLAQDMFNLMPVGTPVIVHSDGAAPQENDTASPPGAGSDATPPPASDAPPPPPPDPDPQPDPHPTPAAPRTPRPPRTPPPFGGP